MLTIVEVWDEYTAEVTEYHNDCGGLIKYGVFNGTPCKYCVNCEAKEMFHNGALHVVIRTPKIKEDTDKRIKRVYH